MLMYLKNVNIKSEIHEVNAEIMKSLHTEILDIN